MLVNTVDAAAETAYWA